jgi:serpin B
MRIAKASALTLLTLLAGCSSAPATGRGTENISDNGTAANVISAEDRASLAASAQGFAADSYSSLRDQFAGQNVFYSPFSAQVALAMTTAGAKSDTLDQMTSALRLNLPQERLHPAMKWLADQLNSRGKNAHGLLGQPFSLKVVNSLWGEQSITFGKSFLDTVKTNYAAGVKFEDFVNDAETARGAINQWVSDQTNMKIQDLLAPGAVDASTRMVLVNAVYFNASWGKQFEETATKKIDFTKVDGTTVKSDQMVIQDSFRYFVGTGYEAVEIPYDGNELAMVVVVPDSGNFDLVDSAVSADAVQTIENGLAFDGDVQLGLPKFKLTPDTFSLKPALAKLGMEKAFSDAADFSGISTDDAIKLSDVVQKAFISVDEHGTEAAAATAAIAVAESAVLVPKVHPLLIDRPFDFYIRDNATKTPIFVGRVVDPTQN